MEFRGECAEVLFIEYGLKILQVDWSVPPSRTPTRPINPLMPIKSPAIAGTHIKLSWRWGGDRGHTQNYPGGGGGDRRGLGTHMKRPLELGTHIKPPIRVLNLCVSPDIWAGSGHSGGQWSK
jgi:hypothetical protein